MHKLLPIALGAAVLIAACGQKGPLVRPSRTPTSPVIIRAPAPPPAPVPAATPATPQS